MRAHPAGKLGEGATAVTGAELCKRQFQSTPPREGATSKCFIAMYFFLLFQSTPPARGATAEKEAKERPSIISIHAPREGGDHVGDFHAVAVVDFNPRPPRGGRRFMRSKRLTPFSFQSTPPARGRRRAGRSERVYPEDFNPRPREGGDGSSWNSRTCP